MSQDTSSIADKVQEILARSCLEPGLKELDELMQAIAITRSISHVYELYRDVKYVTQSNQLGA